MKLRLIGTPNKIDKSLVRHAMHFYIENLIGKNTNHIKLYINFVDNLIKETSNKAFSWPTLKAFKTKIDSNIGRIATLKCLAHEAVHIKQFACEELVFHTKRYDTVLWLGKEMDWNQHDLKIYYNAPWEIEAYGREIALYEFFKINGYSSKINKFD